jgi:pectin methylesterase-like acyl-CoA thioesterase
VKAIALVVLLIFTPIAFAVHGDKLDLSLGSVGYSWTQDLEGREGKNGQSAWVEVNINEHITLELNWKTSRISTPFDDGDDRLVLDLEYSF